MIDALLSFGLSNLCLSLAMAAVAWTVQKKTEQPLLAHLLWLLVLLKLLTPSFFTLPLLEVPAQENAALQQLEVAIAENAAAQQGTSALTSAAMPDAAEVEASAAPGSWASNLSINWQWLKSAGLAVWWLGSSMILLWSLARVIRFQRLLQSAAVNPTQDLERLVEQQAQMLGLLQAPKLRLVKAQIAPMIWWIGGRPKLLLPQQLTESLPADELRWLIAHEVAHVRRRDHWVRWVEWLACVAFWWNPITWVSRKYLRINEEICTDALVLRSLQPNPKTYANSLLNAVEFLIEPLQRPPAMASEINSGGALEKRLKMILRKRPLSMTPRWVNVGVLLSALVLLPLGVAHAQEPNTQAVAKRLIAAVQAGEISDAQAKAMMGALAEQRFTEQLAAVKGHGKKKKADKSKDGLAARYLEAGITRKTYTKVAKGLHQKGVKGEVLDSVMRVLLHSVHATRKGAGEEFYKGMDAKMTELGLTRYQSELVFGYAKKLAVALDNRDSKYKANAKGVAEYKKVNSELLAKMNEIQQQMDAGKLNREEGEAMLKRIKAHMAEMQKKMNAEMERGAKEKRSSRYSDEQMMELNKKVEYLRLQVAEGEMSREQAQEVLDRLTAEMNQQNYQKGSAPERAELEDQMKALKSKAEQVLAAQKAGRISEVEAQEALQKIRQQMGELKEKAGQKKRN